MSFSGPKALALARVNAEADTVATIAARYKVKAEQVAQWRADRLNDASDVVAAVFLAPFREKLHAKTNAQCRLS